MRIAVFIKATTYNESFGGLETQNKLLCEGLARTKHSVVVVAPAPEVVPKQAPLIGDTGYWILNTKYLKYFFVDAPAGKYSKQWFRGSLKAFRELHEESPFDVIISQSMAGQAVIRSLPIPQSQTLKKFQESDSFPRQAPRSVPVVVIQHGTILGELKTRWRSVKERPVLAERTGLSVKKLGGLAFFFFRLTPYGAKIYIQDQLRLRRADAIIAVSDQVKEALVREHFLPEEKIAIVYNGVEVEKFRSGGLESGKTRPFRKDGSFLVRESDKIILYVGRVEKEKGLEVLLEAISRIAYNAYRITLLIVGDGSHLLDLKGLAERLGIADRVIFTGRVPYEKVPNYYAAADLFVLPSLREEGLPMTLPEAMAAGLPIVASRIGGIPAAVRDGETGILVESGSAEELSAAISKILSDDELRSRMGQSARQVAEEKFSQEAMVEGTLKVINEVLDKSRR